MTAQPNPLPRSERRHMERATNAEWEHASAGHTKPTPGCWFCEHKAGEHLDHDFIVEACPDCAENLEYAELLAKYRTKR